MSITASITQTDGVFTNDMNVANFNPLSGSYTFQINQVCKVSLTDSGNNDNNVTDAPVIALKGSTFHKIYNHSNGQWELFSTIDDLSSYNIVIKGAENTGNYDIYFAKDVELSLIPNFTEQARIRYRITSQLNTGNVNSYKKIKFLATGDTGVTPIIPYSINQGPSSLRVGFIGATLENNTMKLRDYSMELDTATAIYGAEVLRFPQYSQFIELANSEIADLDTRVSILEADVQHLTAKVNEHDRILKDLPALVAAVSSDVSKLYVAR